MSAGERATIRVLPEAPIRAAVLSAVEGRRLELTMEEGGEAPGPSSTVEITTPTRIFLGVVETSQDRRIGVAVEHLLDRAVLAELHAAWGEAGLNA